MALAPPYTGYCKITGQAFRVVADTSTDTDKYPDGLYPTGTCVLHVNLDRGYVAYPGATPGVAVIPEDITMTLDAQGYWTVNGDREIYIPPTNDPAGSPKNFTWTATFDLKNAAGKPLPIPTFDFQAPMNTEVNIWAVGPASSSGGVISTQGAAGVRGYSGDMGTAVDKSGVSGALDLSNLVADSQVVNVNATGNLTLALAAMPTIPAGAAGGLTLRVSHNGARTITFESTIKAAYGVDPQLTQQAAATVDLISLIWTGYEWVAMLMAPAIA